MNTRLTLGIPMYNEKQWIDKTLGSILDQSYSDFQLIVLDDESSDSSYQIASEFASKDNRITLLRNRRNLGNLETFLKILKLVNTELFGWVGAHDLLDRNYIRELVRALDDKPEINYVYGNLCFIDEIGNLSGRDMEQIKTRINSTRIENYFDMIGQCRKGGINFHGIYRREILTNFEKTQRKTLVGWDHVILSRANFFGASYVSSANYLMRIFSARQSTTFTRLISNTSSARDIKPSYIFLMVGYIRDFISLPIASKSKVHGVLKLVKKVPYEYQFSLMKNLMLFIIFNLKSKYVRLEK